MQPMDEEESTRWNPRYLAYCKAQGIPDPDAMLAHDEDVYPGGKMTGFILWINACWSQFFRFHPELRGDRVALPSTHDLFDRWLK